MRGQHEPWRQPAGLDHPLCAWTAWCRQEWCVPRMVAAGGLVGGDGEIREREMLNAGPCGHALMETVSSVV